MIRLISLNIGLLIILLCGGAFAQEANPDSERRERSDQIYRLQLRVIFAGKTGFYGTVPPQLADMQGLLTSSFQFASYQLAYTIRLSLFSDEEISARIFPEHYVRVIPKGTAQEGEALKAKIEIYHVPPQDNSETRYFLGTRLKSNREEEPERQIERRRDREADDSFPVMGVEETIKKQGKKPLFPLMSAAAILTKKDWEAFGGVSIRLNNRNEPSSNTLSAGSSLQGGGTTGVEKHLIVGVKLERR